MAEIIPIQQGAGSYLCSIALYRRADGTIAAQVNDMPTPVIEAQATITKRFLTMADWCFEAGIDFMRQGVRFDEESREFRTPDEGSNDDR